MRATLVVESQAKYKKWFNETAKLSGAKVVDGKPVAAPATERRSRVSTCTSASSQAMTRRNPTILAARRPRPASAPRGNRIHLRAKRHVVLQADLHQLPARLAAEQRRRQVVPHGAIERHERVVLVQRLGQRARDDRVVQAEIALASRANNHPGRPELPAAAPRPRRDSAGWPSTPPARRRRPPAPACRWSWSG